jgi:UDP-GlcNAc:undecaprenyl-phosphate GlcNAc-1-phosphate transferase
MILLLPLAVSLGVCLLIAPVVRALAARYGLVDRPDGRRKIHSRITPLAGGVAILLSGSAAVVAALLTPTWLSDRLDEQGFQLLGLLLAAIVICAIGLADDYGCLRGRHKLFGQILAALVAVQFGGVVREIHVFDWRVELGLLAIPFTVCWLLGAINSLNLIDGMDGLLSSVGLILSLTLAGMAVLGEKWAVACVALALAGALLGFLRYNFPPASMFLGDSGSMLIGLMIGTLAIQGSLKGPATVALVAPMALLTIPFLDTAAAIIRRKLTGRSIYTTDRGHLHHCLLRRGLSNRRVLLWVSCCCLFTGAGALTSLVFRQEVLALLAAAAVIAILIVSQVFGYAEFVLMRKFLLRFVASLLRRHARGRPQQTEVRLQGTADWAELWANLTLWGHRLQLRMIRLNVNAPALHEGYHACWDSLNAANEEMSEWRADIPLTFQGHMLGRLEVIGERNHEPIWQKMATVLEVVEKFEAAAYDMVLGGEWPRLAEAVSGQPARYPPVETPTEDYPERTERSVRDSDATLILTRGKPDGGTAPGRQDPAGLQEISTSR